MMVVVSTHFTISYTLPRPALTLMGFTPTNSTRDAPAREEQDLCQSRNLCKIRACPIPSGSGCLCDSRGGGGKFARVLILCIHVLDFFSGFSIAFE